MVGQEQMRGLRVRLGQFRPEENSLGVYRRLKGMRRRRGWSRAE